MDSTNKSVLRQLNYENYGNAQRVDEYLQIFAMPSIEDRTVSLMTNEYGEQDAARQLNFTVFNSSTFCNQSSQQLIVLISRIGSDLYWLKKQSVYVRPSPSLYYQKIDQIEARFKEELNSLTQLNRTFMDSIPVVTLNNYRLLSSLYADYRKQAPENIRECYSDFVATYLEKTGHLDQLNEFKFKFNEAINNIAHCELETMNVTDATEFYVVPTKLSLTATCIRYIIQRTKIDNLFKIKDQKIVNFDGKLTAIPIELIESLEENTKWTRPYVTQDIFTTEKLENYWLQREKEENRLKAMNAEKLAKWYATIRAIKKQNQPISSASVRKKSFDQEYYEGVD